MRVLGIAGSLRRDSHNVRLLRAAAGALPRGADFEVWEGLASVPPYDEDADGPDEQLAVACLRRALRGADAVRRRRLASAAGRARSGRASIQISLS